MWKGENMEPVSFKDEGEGFASEEKSTPVYHNFCHLHPLREPLRNSQGYSTDGGWEFLKAISTLLITCVNIGFYYFLFDFITIADYSKSKLKKSFIAWVCFVF